MKQHEQRAHLAVQRAEEAEKAAAQRDAELADAVARMRQYEKGEFGLSEAVTEIDRIKTQLRFRDEYVDFL